MNQPAQQSAVPSAASAVRAQCAGVALEEAAFGNSRRKRALRSERRAESIGGRGGRSGGAPIERTYSPCIWPSAWSCDGCIPGELGSGTADASRRGSLASAAYLVRVQVRARVRVRVRVRVKGER